MFVGRRGWRGVVCSRGCLEEEARGDELWVVSTSQSPQAKGVDRRGCWKGRGRCFEETTPSYITGKPYSISKAEDQKQPS